MKYLPLYTDWSTVSHFLKADKESRATIGFAHNFGFQRPETLVACIAACGALTTRGHIPVIFGVVALAASWHNDYRALEIFVLKTHPEHKDATGFLIDQATQAAKALGFQYLFRRSRKSLEVLASNETMQLSAPLPMLESGNAIDL